MMAKECGRSEIDGSWGGFPVEFIYFLEQNHSILKQSGERKITDTTLVAIALLIAISDPKEKDVMIKIITNLLKG